jgi:hypothetical protein
MAIRGRFLPHAPQHHRMLPQGPAERQKPTRFSRWTLRGECLLCQQMRSFGSNHLTDNRPIGDALIRRLEANTDQEFLA